MEKIIIIILILFLIVGAVWVINLPLKDRIKIENAEEFICQYYWGRFQSCWKLLREEVVDFGEEWGGEQEVWVIWDYEDKTEMNYRKSKSDVIIKIIETNWIGSKFDKN